MNNVLENSPTWLKFSQAEKPFDGPEGEYVKSQAEELNHYLEALESGKEPEFAYPGWDWQESYKAHTEQIKALFAVSDMLMVAGHEENFLGLTHTMMQYCQSVIMPMQTMLQEGDVEGALALYHQPRHYSR